VVDQIALLGTGLMGAPIARNLARSGFPVTVWNRTAAKAVPLAAEDVAIAASAAEAVSGADLVISLLSDGPTTSEALFGESGVARAMRPGATVAMMSSINPETATEQAARLAELGIDYIDAPVSGGERGAIARALTIFAGGSVRSIDAARPALELLGRVNRVGGVGAGQLVKLANQMIVGISIEAIAEALLLIERGGGDPEAAFAALKGGFADSTVLRQHGGRMLSRNHAPGATIATQRKDLRMATGLAAKLALSLPLLDQVAAMYEQAAAGADSELDHSAIHRTLRARQQARGE
jgi:2-hydroxy-3-oxopropionate reductase